MLAFYRGGNQGIKRLDHFFERSSLDSSLEHSLSA